MSLVDESLAPAALIVYSTYLLIERLQRSNFIPIFAIARHLFQRLPVQISCYVVSFFLALTFSPKVSAPFIYFQF
ncbi:MAG: hypothetical protein C0469_06655 [Cyanobacteria bacterium DS2.3.42]|nr:hypothetical protein [Cyanobacteria bacterium DS2.3.42]